MEDVATRSGLRPEDGLLRFGLHWGAGDYVGQILTRARAEVTALGDEVNEAARIQACASGGRALVSKALIEGLESGDIAALGFDIDHLASTPLRDLGTATEKGRREPR